MIDLVAPPDGDLGDLEATYATETLATTLDRMVAFNKRFITHRHDSTHDPIALWVASTHAMPVWDWHGRLYITAPQPGCGKSTQSEVMSLMCPNSDEVGSTSGPGLFRNISANQPTLFIDEAESQFSRHSGRDGDIVNQVINSGYKRGKVVTRSEGNQTVKHPVYAAVTIVGIDNGTLADTTRSRCIPVQMVPGKNGERFRARLHADFAAEIQWHLASHAHDLAIVEIPDGFGRQTDIWEALYSVAVAAGETWVERFHGAAEVHVWPEDVSESSQVLAAIAQLFNDRGTDRLGSSEVLGYLQAREDLPEVSSTRALSRVWLQGYRTEDGRHIKATKSNGVYVYWRKDFDHAFSTWL